MPGSQSYPPSPTGGFRSQSSDDGGMSVGNGHAAAAAITRTSSQCSSQESQLLHLSRVASMQEKLVDDAGDPAGMSRKRMADGKVKDVVPRGLHSRTASTVSMSSASGGRIGELTAELKTRLSYAMVKVNHGWQAHSIDEVESLASQAASPTSSSSTVPRRVSTSPALSQGALRPGGTANSTPSHSSYESPWADGAHQSPGQNTAQSGPRALAPPAPIQPGQSLPPPQQHQHYDGRSTARPGYTPTPLSYSHTAVSPQTPYPHPPPMGRRQATTPRDPIVFSPHQTVRDQDAIEALISMSSPGGNGVLGSFPPRASPRTHHHLHQNHQQHYPPASSAPARMGRHALPNSQPRKSLPSGRPPRTTDLEYHATPDDSPQRTPRRRVNGRIAPLRSSLSMSAALGAGVGRRLGDDEIERMLERAGEEESEDEGEILIPRLSGVVRLR